MQNISKNSLWLGIAIALLTTASAFLGAPKGIEEFTVPIWDILLQFNLCSGFVFVILGVLDHMETPHPQVAPALTLFTAGFITYVFGCLPSAMGAPIATQLQLFLFALSVAFIVVGWAQFGLSVFRQADR